MNTITLPETEAIAAVAAAQELLMLPLSRLRPSKRNVRPSGGTPIFGLAASIARVGLIQNLTVTGPTGDGGYEVVAGKRRLTALKLLVQRKRLSRAHEVPCLVVPEASARTVSLTENVQREAMHPADQFTAFAALVAEGRPVEDIAADFGVTPLVVQRRLKLANVSPRLLADYRREAVTLEQLMALAITDDHTAQEAAFYESPQWQRSPQALREHLTEREIDGAQDALARFVGLDAYTVAGGGLRRDLFADETQGVYLSDAALLETLARDKLANMTDQVRAEGWAWVETVPRLTAAELHGFERTRRDRRAPTKAEAKRVAKLQVRQQAIDDMINAEDSEDIAEEAAQALYAEGDHIDSELDAINESLLVYPPETLPLAGAIVSVDQKGAITVHRGLLREAEAKILKQQERQAKKANGKGEGETEEPATARISEKLTRRLSAHRTAALQAEVARHPEVALVAVVHRLALRVLLDDYGAGDLPIHIAASPQDGLEKDAPDVATSPALVGLRAVRHAWTERLPQDPEALFAELLAFPQAELLALLAVCVATTVGAVTSREDSLPAVALAQAVSLDMHPWWAPTAEGYFAHVSKAKAIEAVQVFAPEQAARLAKLKKNELAAEAERLAAGSGWLPAMLQTTTPEAKGTATD